MAALGEYRGIFRLLNKQQDMPSEEDYIVSPSVLSCSNLKLHQTLEVKNLFKEEKHSALVNV